MTPIETVRLVALVQQLCPAQRVEDLTPDAWSVVLRDVPYADAEAAVAEIAKRARWIAPVDIVGEVRSMRARRYDAANVIYEPASPDETPQQMRERMRQLRRAAADGNVIPMRPALPAGETALVPTEIGRIVADRRDAHRERTRLLAVRCPWCGAAPGVPCEVPNLGADRRAQHLTATRVHPSRAEAAEQAERRRELAEATADEPHTAPLRRHP